MSIAAVSGSNSVNYQTQAVQQTQQDKSQSGTSSSVGEAAVLELTGTSGSSASSVSSVSQSSGGGGTSSSSNSCPLGNTMCLGCGQCGKTTAKSSSNANTLFSQSSTAQKDTNTDYLTATAINAYEATSVTL